MIIIITVIISMSTAKKVPLIWCSFPEGDRYEGITTHTTSSIAHISYIFTMIRASATWHGRSTREKEPFTTSERGANEGRKRKNTCYFTLSLIGLVEIGNHLRILKRVFLQIIYVIELAIFHSFAYFFSNVFFSTIFFCYCVSQNCMDLLVLG